MNLKALLLSPSLAAVAFGIGCGLAFAFIAAWGSLFPFRPEWDDTWRDFLPVGIAYAIWFGTSLGIFLVGLRSIRRSIRGGPPSDIHRR